MFVFSQECFTFNVIYSYQAWDLFEIIGVLTTKNIKQKPDLKIRLFYLKEEQWYSAELRKEVERLSNAVQRGRIEEVETDEVGGRRRSSAATSSIDQEEKVLFETQVAALEQAKIMCKIKVTFIFIQIFNYRNVNI